MISILNKKIDGVANPGTPVIILDVIPIELCLCILKNPFINKYTGEKHTIILQFNDLLLNEELPDDYIHPKFLKLKKRFEYNEIHSRLKWDYFI